MQVATTAATTAIDAEFLGCGTTLLSISNMKDIIKILRSLDDAGILMKSVTQTIEKETKKTETLIS